MFPQLWDQSGGQPGQVLLRSRLQMCTGLSACCVLSGGEKDPSSKDAEPVAGTPPCDLIPPPKALPLKSSHWGLGFVVNGGREHTSGTQEREAPSPPTVWEWEPGRKTILPFGRVRRGRGAVCPYTAHIFWGQGGSRCSCQAWQEPGSRPALRNAAGHCPSPQR